MIDINVNKCNGCKQLDEPPRCVDICPGNLLFINQDGKAAIYDPSECWDCFACVKSCPRLALSIRLPFQINESMARLTGHHVNSETVWEFREQNGALIRRYRTLSRGK